MVVIFKDQQNLTLHFLQSNDTLTADQLQEVGKLAINLEDAIQDIYQENVQEYASGNTTIRHNHGSSPNRVGVLLLNNQISIF